MNAHQKRKFLRRQSMNNKKPKLIRNWADLAKVPDSDAGYTLEIDVEGCHGWIKKKGVDGWLGDYLSTHTFYGSNYLQSTRILRRYGFNITIDNWDKDNK